MTAPGLEDEVAAAAAGYRLAFGGQRLRGRLGQRRGQGPGSSLEFHDYRDYAAGDDLRHVDWRGYARTDKLTVRLHEAEVAPIVEVLLDTSASMAITAGKRRAALALTAALARWARGEGASARLQVLGGSALGGGTLGGGTLAAADLEQLPFDGAATPAPPPSPLRSGSVRVLISDGLWPAGPGQLLPRLAGGGARLIFLQLLDPAERRPETTGARTLVDVETGARASLRLDEATLRRYAARLDRLCDGLRQQIVALAGAHIAVTADRLAEMCRRDLVPARFLEPA